MASSSTQEEVEMHGHWVVAKSYDVLLQWIHDDTYKTVMYKLPLTIGEARNVFDKLEQNTTLFALCLNKQPSGDELCGLASALLLKNKNFPGLGLWRSNISSEGASLIAKSFLNNESRLKQLSLCDNDIGDIGVISIVKALKGNDCLRILDLQRTGCGDKAAIELSEMLPLTNTLDYLWLANNSISDEGAKALLSGAKKNKSIVLLNLDENNEVSEQIMSEIEDRVKANMEWQLSETDKTELGSLLIKKNMKEQAYSLHKEGFKIFDQVDQFSKQSYPGILGLDNDAIMMIKQFIEEERSRSSPIGTFLINYGYEKYCKKFYESNEKEVRALDDPELKNIGVEDEDDRTRLVLLIKSALMTQTVPPDQSQVKNIGPASAAVSDVKDQGTSAVADESKENVAALDTAEKPAPDVIPMTPKVNQDKDREGMLDKLVN